MEITKVTVWKNKSETFVANCLVEFDEVFFVKCKIVKSSKDGSLFVSWPSTKGKDKEGNDTYYPEAGYVLGEDEETKYDYKNSTDEKIIAEYNKSVGIESSKPKVEKTEVKEKKAAAVNFPAKKK